MEIRQWYDREVRVCPSNICAGGQCVFLLPNICSMMRKNKPTNAASGARTNDAQDYA